MAISSGKIIFSSSDAADAKTTQDDLMSEGFLKTIMANVKGISIETNLVTGSVTFNITGDGVSTNMDFIKASAEAATGKTATNAEIVAGVDSPIDVGG